MPKGICQIDNCRRVVHARGMCAYHYRNWLAEKNGSAQCGATRCSSLAVLDGLCRNHYMQRRRMDERHAEVAGKRCSVVGCRRPYDAGGYCNLHYGRARRNGGDPGPAESKQQRHNGEPYPADDGYMERRVNGRRIAEHRYQMQLILGRDLFKGETVHHKNGRHGDNRRSNLELWVTPQPAGQRPEDLVEWIVDHYPDLVRQAIKE